MSSILLVGNGPNYFSSGNHGWTHIMRWLAKGAGIRNEFERLKEEPLPIVYDRINAQHLIGDRNKGEALAKEIDVLRPNGIHQKLVELNWHTILTTNYDYCLETATGETFKNANLARETRYSAFRRRRSNERSVWHIHGEANSPNTMMLGFDHYVGYVQKLRNYITDRNDGSPFFYATQNKDIEDTKHSWVDLFFRDNVHIVGLGLGYSEVVLWWLISYKQKLTSQRKLACGKTTYYHMGQITKEDVGRLELLKGFGVKIEHIDFGLDSKRNPTESTWDNAIKKLKKASAA